MLVIRLEKELEEQLDLLAKIKQSNRSAVVREAVIRYLEDNKDLELARKSLVYLKRTRSLKELRRDLGLDG